MAAGRHGPEVWSACVTFVISLDGHELSAFNELRGIILESESVEHIATSDGVISVHRGVRTFPPKRHSTPAGDSQSGRFFCIVVLAGSSEFRLAIKLSKEREIDHLQDWDALSKVLARFRLADG